ncbi:MAG: tetratricopeptide repeat protein [Deltaproteobacteria bacterium]|nr:tetratricopeptide repeat protein [Deltaproteobacteria bacterium]
MLMKICRFSPLNANRSSAAALVILLLLACLCWTPGCSHSPRKTSTELTEVQYDGLLEAFAARDFPRIKKELAQLHADGVKDKRISYLEAMLALIENRPEKAKPFLIEALELDPQYSEAHNALGTIYMEEKELAKAETEFIKAVSNPLYPTPEKAYHNLGNLYRLQKRNDLALACYQKALKFNHDYFPSHYELARLYFSQHQYEPALKEIKRAQEISPRHPGVWLVIGQLDLAMDDEEDARDAFKQVISLQPIGSFADQARKELKKLGK